MSQKLVSLKRENQVDPWLYSNLNNTRESLVNSILSSGKISAEFGSSTAWLIRLMQTSSEASTLTRSAILESSWAPILYTRMILGRCKKLALLVYSISKLKETSSREVSLGIDCKGSTSLARSSASVSMSPIKMRMNCAPNSLSELNILIIW